jgi:phospholipid-binding lipoprotein MlaA
MGLEKHEEDFGQTLGYWGVSSGPYIVVPLFGPYTVRDGFGRVVDGSTSDYVSSLDHVPTRNQLLALRAIDDRSNLFEAEKLITGDRYSFIRDAYLQHRDFLVNDGVLEDDFGDSDFEDWEE